MMLLKTDILKDSGIKYDWNTMYVALYLDFINGVAISDYATEVMGFESYVDNEFICELAWEGESFLKEQILEKMLINLGVEEVQKGSDSWNKELRKLRFCILKFLKATVTDKKTLLDKVSEVYADVGYPNNLLES